MQTERFDTPKQDEVSRLDASLLPKTETRPPWVYIHNPLGWEVVCTGGDPSLPLSEREKNPDNWEFLPMLGRIEGEDGANGVKYDKRSDTYSFALAIQVHAARGTVAILPTDRRLGRWHRYNSRYFPCEGGGKHYCEPGERLAKLPNGMVISRPNADEFNAFRRHLKEAGLVEPMQAEVYENSIRVRSQQRLRRAENAKNPDRARDKALMLQAREEAAWAKETAAAMGGAMLLDEPVMGAPVTDEVAEAAEMQAVKVRKGRA